MLLYQDIPDNVTEVVTELSQNNTLAELMAIAFVLGMLSLPIFATYLVARAIRSPKAQDKQEDDNDMIYAVAIGKLAESFSGPLQDVTEVLRGIVASQSRQEMLIMQIRDDTTEYIKNKDTVIQTGIAAVEANTVATAQHTESVDTMTKELQDLTDAVASVRDDIIADIKTMLSEEGVMLSESALSKVADNVMAQFSTKFEELKSCIEDAIKTATQETPSVTIDSDKPPEEKTQETTK